MCGIYGYIGKNAYNQVFNGLSLLQYRGYDSCGIAYFENGEFKINKAVGVLNKLNKVQTKSKIAFGHTRWATNGVVNYLNTHPHISFDKKTIIVHNGIVKNAEIIKEELKNKGINFYSNTDTEVIANYLSYGDFTTNLNNIFNKLKGSFSLIIAREDIIYLVKKFSPLNILKTKNEIIISSDVSSLKDGGLYSLIDNDILMIKNNQIFSLTDHKIKFIKHENELKSTKLGVFNHFMIKEINDTPQAILDCYNYLSNLDLTFLSNYSKITLVGCGTAYNSCLIAEYFLNRYTKFKVNTILASNYENNRKISKKHLFVIVSQSGETADCIKVAENIIKYGGKFLAVTNEPNSTIARKTCMHIFTKAKKEFAVASTKTYCCQLFIFSYIIKKLKNPNFTMDINNFTQKLKHQISNCDIDEIVKKIQNLKHLILIGKDIDYLTLLEASLKIREIDYIYTLPIYSGELKHGTLSLIDENSVVLALNSSNDDNKLQIAKNEIISRGGTVFDMEKFVETDIDELFKPIFTIIPFQLISYKTAINLGRNPDMPRNLAKSVTVE